MRLGTTNQFIPNLSVDIAQIINFTNLFIVITLLTGIFAGPMSAFASILNKMNTTQLAKEAKEVRIGEVMSTWTSPDPENKMFYTYVKIRVEKTIKGKPEVKEMLLRQPGGAWKNPETGRMTYQKVFGMSTFKQGERALMFINHSKDGAPSVMFQGKREIVKDETGQDVAVEESNDDVEYANQPHHEKGLYAARERKSLDSVVSEIQRAINENKGDLNK